MSFLQAASEFTQGMFWGFVLFPVAWYFAKPSLKRLYNDVVYCVNPILAKFTAKSLNAA